MDELTHSIAEASEMLGVSYRTLHYYEDKIGLQINRDSSGNRTYSDHDIDLFVNIIELKKKGMSLDGIKALFLEKQLISKEEDHRVVVIDDKALEMKEYLINEISAVVALQVREGLLEVNSKMDQLIEENKELVLLLKDSQSQSTDQYLALDNKITHVKEEAKVKKTWFGKRTGKSKGISDS